MNLAGRVSGDLTVIKRFGSYKDEDLWLCRCNCGNRHIALQSRLTDGSITNCGCKKRGRKRADITGQRFGKLVAQEYLFDDYRNQACWLFRCDCGNEKILSYNQVKWGGVSSCGCVRRERTSNLKKTDITGQRFGRLIAVKPTKQRHGSGSIVWECTCDCGNTAFYTVNQLRFGNVRSCGCLYQESRTDWSGNRKDLTDDTSITGLLTAKHPRIDNTSGVTGVYLDRKSSKWIAYISFQKKRHYLGIFERKDDAIKARQRAEQEFHDPLIEEHWEEMPQKRQDEYLAYLNGIIEYPPSVNI